MKIKVGLIGCGRWAQESYLPYLMKNSLIDLVALSGVVPYENGEVLAKEIGFTSHYRDWVEMIEKEKLDLVIITTPHAHHYTQIKYCLEKSIHVQVDKPPALKLEEVNDLLQIAKEKGVMVNVHTQRRFYEEYLYAKKCIAEGLLGDIQFVQGDFGQELFSDFKNSWRSNPELAGGGIMTDSGYHILDTILYILGKTEVKSVAMVSNNGEFQSDTYSTLTLKLNKGCVITLNVIRGLPKKIALERIQLVGTKGWINISRDKKAGERTLTVEHYNDQGILVKQMKEHVCDADKIAPIKNFIQALIHNEKLISSLEEAALSVAVLEAGYKSSQSNQIITL